MYYIKNTLKYSGKYLSELKVELKRSLDDNFHPTLNSLYLKLLVLHSIKCHFITTYLLCINTSHYSINLVFGHPEPQ